MYRQVLAGVKRLRTLQLHLFPSFNRAINTTYKRLRSVSLASYLPFSLSFSSSSSASSSSSSFLSRRRPSTSSIPTVRKRRPSISSRRRRLVLYSVLFLLAFLLYLVLSLLRVAVSQLSVNPLTGLLLLFHRRIVHVSDDTYVSDMLRPGVHVPTDKTLRAKLARRVDERVGDSVASLWRHVDTNCPPEIDPPDPALYGTGNEQCYAIGMPSEIVTTTNEQKKQQSSSSEQEKNKVNKGDPALFWQMNSRACCVTRKHNVPTCLHGPKMDRMMTFDARGTTTCQVIAVQQHDANFNPQNKNNSNDGMLMISRGVPQQHTIHARDAGLNESCAAFRKRYVTGMFGQEEFRPGEFQRFAEEADDIFRKRQAVHHLNHRVPIRWLGEQSDVVIIVPKYPWSNNICHYGRLWNFVLWTIHNLHRFNIDIDTITAAQQHRKLRVDVLFRARPGYNQPWHRGLRDATLRALEIQENVQVRVAHVRRDMAAEFQCTRRPTIWLGREGRVDAFPFLNDSAVWAPAMQVDDSHWPVIPHDSMWLRNAVLDFLGLPIAANYTTSSSSSSSKSEITYTSIRVPPRRVAVLQRAKRSRRRFTPSGQRWWERTLRELCEKYQMDLRHVRVSYDTSFRDQVSALHDVGISVGLHGANIVNSMFQPPAGALFEIFPWRYVRYYYAAGANSGLRYSYHEPIAGSDPNCTSFSVYCAFRYREAIVYLTEIDRWRVKARLEKVFMYIDMLHRKYPDGVIPLKREGNIYRFEGEDEFRRKREQLQQQEQREQ